MSFLELRHLTRDFFIQHNIGEDHGFKHAEAVSRNAIIACFYYEKEKKQSIPVDLIVAAAFLHDVDDRKFFPDSKHFKNARMLLEKAGYFQQYQKQDIELICQMIDLVSTSKNGNSKMENVKDDWMYIPGDSDRVEALGKIGVKRCYDYSKSQNPFILFTKETPKIISDEELETKIDLKKRFEQYVANKGHSESMIDHYYDKLLTISQIKSNNTYLQELANERHCFMKNWLFEFNKIRRDPNLDYFDETKKINEMLDNISKL
jgi:uncharacterized protein